MEKINIKHLMIGLLIFSQIVISGCQNKKEDITKLGIEKYEAEFIGTFDVKIQVIGYSESELEFTDKSNIIYNKMKELNQLFDIYNDYEGVSNLKTINDNAGIQPIEVDRQIIDLLLFSIDAYEKTDGLTNIAMGAPLKIWHEYRMEGIESKETAKLPSIDELKQADEHTNIENVIIDVEKNTVFLSDPQMSLDVGAIAKGYAAEVAKDAAIDAGLDSAIINAGGNLVVIGSPKDGIRERWGIGIQDPKKTVDGVTNIFDTVYLNDKAVVSSGDYQRFYEVDNESYHHIIDPDTLFPAKNFASVSVIHHNSAVADYLSTAVFIANYEQGLEIVKAHGAEAIWVFHNGEAKATDGYKKISKMFGGISSN